MRRMVLNSFERFVLLQILFLLAIGFFLVFTNVDSFENYIREDGIVEWLTVLSLLAAAFFCMQRAVTLTRYRGVYFMVTNLVLAVLLIIAAGEEISWGQRLFGIETPEYFRENNLQEETNLHNLKINGVEINRLVFSYLLISALVIYLGVFPILYQKKEWMRRFADRWGIPMPQLYQVLGFLFVFVITALIPHGKRAELLECCACLLFLLMILYPANAAVFQRQVIKN
ncbi:MAG: hypothetical protein WKF70_07430 [Chitinophagaceae bacterium]